RSSGWCPAPGWKQDTPPGPWAADCPGINPTCQNPTTACIPGTVAGRPSPRYSLLCPQAGTAVEKAMSTKRAASATKGNFTSSSSSARRGRKLDGLRAPQNGAPSLNTAAAKASESLCIASQRNCTLLQLTGSGRSARISRRQEDDCPYRIRGNFS